MLLATWLWQHARSPREGVLRSIVCEGRVLTADNSQSNLKIAASEVPVLLVLGGKDVLVPPSVSR